MLKYLSLAAFAGAFALLGWTGASAASQNKTVIEPGSYKVADWDDKICCRKHDHNFWATRHRCDDVGGDRVGNGRCRDHDDDWNDKWDSRWRDWNGDWDRNVCCEKNDNDWWSKPRDCRENGGWIVRDHKCRDHRDWNDNWDSRWRNWNGDWNRKICCQKNDHNWWSQPHECRENGGWIVRDHECRD